MDSKELLKKIFPFSFGIGEDVTKLIINCIIYFVVCAVAGVIIGFLVGIPFVGWLFGIIGSLIGLYGFIGIVLALLDFFKILK